MLKFDYVKIIPNGIPVSAIEHYLNTKNYSNKSLAETGYNESQKSNFEYRKTIWLTLPQNTLLNSIDAIKNLYNNTLKDYYKKDLVSIEGPQFLYYMPGGKYDIHNDSEDIIDGKLTRVCERDVSILIYLNDDYEGGELEFPDFGVKIKPKAGTIIVFPSYAEYSHRVHPVTSGERYNLVAWIKTSERIYSRPYE